MKDVQIKQGDGTITYIVNGEEVTQEVFNQAVVVNAEEERIESNVRERMKKIALESLISENDVDREKYEEEKGKLESSK